VANLYASITGHLSADDRFNGIDIYYGTIPQESDLPALVFNLISINYVGVSHEGAGLNRSRVQIAGVSPLITQADDIRKKVFNSLNNFSGIMGGGLDIQSCLPTGTGRDVFDEKLSWYLAQQDWILEYTEESE
jgi:hypothetical protein